VDRVRAGDQVVEKNAETIDIALDSGLAAAKNLRRQIEGRPGQIGGGVVGERTRLSQLEPLAYETNF
jgi:hypothetical protein